MRHIVAWLLLPAAVAASWSIQYVDLVRYPFATCLDGSPGAFYFKQGANASSMMVHLQGGGWCTSLADCATRASGVSPYQNQPSLGGSGLWGAGPCTGNATLDANTPPCVSDGGSGGIMSDDASINPDMATWSKVWIGYCDGGSFAGSMTAPVMVNATSTVYFRGFYIVTAVIDTLLREFGLAEASTLLLKGCSAGGMAAFIAADRIGEQVHEVNPNIRYLVAPGAGFIMDFPSFAGPNVVEPVLQWVFQSQGIQGSVPAACVNAQNPGEAWRCMFPATLLPYIRSPLFIANSIGDAAQLGAVMQLPCNPAYGTCNATELAYFNSFRAAMVADIQPALQSAAVGAWLVECVVHMVENVDRAWNNITVAGQTQAETFRAWFRGDGSAARIAIDAVWTNGTGLPYGGNPMCGNYGPVPSLPSY